MHAVPPGQMNHDEFDPAIPTAYPIKGKVSIMGEMPVRLRAEGKTLAAYGFGHQRVAIPASEIGTIQSFIVRNREGEIVRSSLAILAKSGEPLLWARGAWGPGLSEIRRSLGIPAVTYPTLADRASYRTRSSLPSGTPVLRTRPPGWLPLAVLAIIVALAMAWAGAFAGAALSLVLPGAIGGVRDLIGIALVIAGGLGGIWLFFAVRSLLADALRWSVASLRAGGIAPWSRFRQVETPDKVLGTLTTVVMGIAIPFLLLWGPIIAGNSLSHGFRDAALVANLRAHGATTSGYVVNDPYYTTDSSGDQEEHDQAGLMFTPAGGSQVTEVADPRIAGWAWPIRPDVPVTIVYDPADPTTAAVQGQITGSVWHGAPTGNIIAGGLALLAEPLLIWLFVRRVTAARRKARDDFVKGLA